MTISMYDASVPGFVRSLGALSAILQKAKAHAAARKISEEVMLDARLSLDMFPLRRQVQIACDFAKGGAGRLAGAELPSYPDTEASFDDLIARIDKTLAYVKSLPAGDIAGSEERDIQLKIGGQDMAFKGQAYLVHFVLPNFYFHYTAAYAILRKNGVELGKTDFIGGLG